MTANSKESFLLNLEEFLTPKITDKPMLFEVFTETQDESDALEIIVNYVNGESRFINLLKSKLRTTVKNALYSTIGENRVDAAKKLIKGR